MIIRYVLMSFLASACINLWSQDTTTWRFTMQDVLAHNDYQKKQPFINAYSHHVGIIEADLYFHQGKVVVVHDLSELKVAQDLETTYLIPLKDKIQRYGGAYDDPAHSIALMLDIKNEPEKILEWILGMVREYPELFGSSGKNCVIPIILSGNRPPMKIWHSLPKAVYIDGRLSDTIPEHLRSKVFMVSSSFSDVVPGAWSSRLTATQIRAVKKAVAQVHDQNLKIRFWGVPDTLYFWELQNEVRVDIIGCDHLDELAKHIE